MTSTADIIVADYGMGNVGSIINMIKKVGAQSVLSSDPVAIGNARKLVLPGVGHFEAGMRHLQETGLDHALNQARDNGAVILGICLGMQLMCRDSEESDRKGLGWFDYPVRKFPNKTSTGEKLLVPHMGWNSVAVRSPLQSTNSYVKEGRFYFVHSYYVDADNEEDCLSQTTYGDVRFASSIGRNNIQGVQFHPEKSHKFGMALFSRFIGD